MITKTIADFQNVGPGKAPVDEKMEVDYPFVWALYALLGQNKSYG